VEVGAAAVHRLRDPLARAARSAIPRRALLAAALLGALAGAPAAGAHGLVIDSSPRHLETVAAPPRLVIRFNSRLEKHLCSVSLVGADKTVVRLAPDGAAAAPDTLAYPLPALRPGPYEARWKVLAADGHVTEGVLRFTVDGAARPR
jgi:methionine-rich copper-binding protein CopC